VLNWMLAAGRPEFARRQPVIAQQLGIRGYLALICRVHQRQADQPETGKQAAPGF